MDISVFQDREKTGLWRVEDRHYGDGDRTFALFAGPDAEQRARDYAEWLESPVEQSRSMPF